jgi:hypothetical protein
MKVGELRLEEMERGVVCGYSKAEGQVDNAAGVEALEGA